MGFFHFDSFGPLPADHHAVLVDFLVSVDVLKLMQTEFRDTLFALNVDALAVTFSVQASSGISSFSTSSSRFGCTRRQTGHGVAALS